MFNSMLGDSKNFIKISMKVLVVIKVIVISDQTNEWLEVDCNVINLIKMD